MQSLHIDCVSFTILDGRNRDFIIYKVKRRFLASN